MEVGEKNIGPNYILYLRADIKKFNVYTIYIYLLIYLYFLVIPSYLIVNNMEDIKKIAGHMPLLTLRNGTINLKRKIEEIISSNQV